MQNRSNPLLVTKYQHDQRKKVAFDLYRYNNKYYLIIVDSHSDFPDLCQINQTNDVVMKVM